MNDAGLWALERQFWLGGAEACWSRVAPDAVIVLPGPKGALTRAQTIDVIRHSPHWNEIAFESTNTIRPMTEVVLLAYEAIGHHEGRKGAYRARCCSMYVNKGGTWLMIFHQQTPA